MEVPYNCMECNHYIEIKGYTQTYQVCELLKRELDYDSCDYKRDNECPIKKPGPYVEPRFFELKCGNIREVKKEKVNE